MEEIAREVYGVISNQDDSIYGGFAANQGFVVLEDSVLVFDSGFSTDSAKLLERTISSVTNKKVRYIVNSHDHSDHVFGNYFFHKKYSSSGLRIISHQICKEKIDKFGEIRLKSYRKVDERLESMLSSVRVCTPNVLYSNTGMKLEIEGTDFIFSHPEVGAHTLGDTVMLMPTKRTVFAGDLVWNSFFPNLEDANIDGWLGALADLDFETYDKFLPGHGELCGKKQVCEFSDYLRKVQERLLSCESKNVEKQQLRSCFEIDGTEKWKFRFIVERNIEALFGNVGRKFCKKKIQITRI